MSYQSTHISKYSLLCSCVARPNKSTGHNLGQLTEHLTVLLELINIIQSQWQGATDT